MVTGGSVCGGAARRVVGCGSYAVHVGDVTDIEEGAKKRAGKTQGKNGPKLGSPEWVEAMRVAREAKKAAKGDTGDAPTSRNSKREEAKDRALEKLVPKAIKVLEAQMKGEPCACSECGHVVDVPDFKLQQSAAVKVLEWGKGKPRQTIEQIGETVQVIRYETAAMGDAGSN